LDYYCQAIQVREQAGMPAVGASVDRRTFQHLANAYSSDKIQSLMCFVCAQIKVDTSVRNTDIKYYTGSYLTECCPRDSILFNLDLNTFKDKYASNANAYPFRPQPHARTSIHHLPSHPAPLR
jgi:hypothetical protein